jgi:class 3 adenylate cyclase
MIATTLRRERLERCIERMDKPLLALAIVTVLLYLLELRGHVQDRAWEPAYHHTVHAIDLVFVADLLLKVAVLRGEYVRKPWFVVDLLSCLPALGGVVSLLAALGWVAVPAPGVQAIRIVRALRLFRVLRTLRMLRMLQAVPAVGRFVAEAPESLTARKFERALTMGVCVFSAALLGCVFELRRAEDATFRRTIDAQLDERLTADRLHHLGASLTQPGHDSFFRRRATVDDRLQWVYVDRREAERQGNLVEFYLVVGALLSTTLFAYVMLYQLRDVSYGQIRTFLNIALPRQVAAQFLRDPSSYARKHRAPATIMFMDFVGFTQTADSLSRDVDRLSEHLERAMDRVVEELMRQDVIIDKFIGDAIMCFRGGPLVAGTPEDHAYRVVRGALDSIRCLEALQDPYFQHMKIGGASAADCLIGAFGTSTRLSYTVLGGAVNLAARLEPASRQCRATTLFCDGTQRLCTGRPDIVWRRWGQLRVPGKAGPVAVYEAFDAATLGPTDFIHSFHEGLAAFERREFQAARTLFHTADQQRAPGDPPSQTYLDWCARLLGTPIPTDWEPVLQTTK